MAAVGAGEVSKLAVLFERHHRSLFRYFVSMNRNRELSEDLVQDVFFRMLRYRGSYDPQQSFTMVRFWSPHANRPRHERQAVRSRFLRGCGVPESVPTSDVQDARSADPECASCTLLPLKPRAGRSPRFGNQA